MARLSYQISTVNRTKRTLRIPESCTLYLCPNSCARRRGLRALRNGELDNVAFLRFSQTDVVTGAYERGVCEACGRVLEALPARPRVMSLYVNCIDDFLGTDARALVDELSELYPDVRFILSRINPISEDVGGSKLQTVHAHLYEPLKPVAAHDRGVTLLGHFESVPIQSEFYRLAFGMGLDPVREVFSCGDYDEYERLAKSCVAVSLSHLGDAALEDFGRRLGIAGMRWHATYSIDEIRKRYEELAELVGGEVDCTMHAAEAWHAVRRARLKVGELSIAVDSSASLRPFSLALDLLSYGFNVEVVFAFHAKASDSAALEKLKSSYPNVSVVREGGAEAILGIPQGGDGQWIAVGGDSAFVLKTSRTVHMYHDEGFFGFQGVVALMDALVAAVEGDCEGDAETTLRQEGIAAARCAVCSGDEADAGRCVGDGAVGGSRSAGLGSHQPAETVRQGG